ncbi:hypothetical protein MBAV_004743 [Candidatus Magnetobacterium bavaricum]|uniref:Uncharacterized protein n=1 Tax=Candidatus Magnetobacterium bavaricum TaxID=29290 RepID=A0A0F3GM58_9BACT|nr:hypothetical protein MBAV_004743 [Candidatus Magnetobacterium bavaricum]
MFGGVPVIVPNHGSCVTLYDKLLLPVSLPLIANATGVPDIVIVVIGSAAILFTIWTRGLVGVISAALGKCTSA